MLTGLVKQELWRLATRVRFALLFVAMVAIGIAIMVSSRGDISVGPEGSSVMTAPMMLLSNVSNIAFFLCLWPIVFGGTLAEDLATNYSAVILVRARTRWRWVASKIIASLILSVGLMLCVGATWSIVARLIAPWEPGTAAIVVGMADEFAARQPLLLAFLAFGMLGVAGAAVATFSHVLGALVRSTFTGQVVASVLYTVATLALPGPINPGSMGSALSATAPWATPSWVVSYWFIALGGLAAITYVVVRRKESR